MKKVLALLSVLLLPVAASAQVVPRVLGLEPGITVQGHGTVKVPVKTLAFVAFARGNVEEKAALAAMRAAGILDPSLGPAGSTIGRGNQSSMLRGTITGVTEEKLEKIGLAAADYARQHSDVTIENISFAPRFDDCAANEDAARAAAFADARRRAQAVASVAGLSLDGVVAVSESGGCPTIPDGPQIQAAGQSLDQGTLTATVTINETVTFGVAAANGARRQPL